MATEKTRKSADKPKVEQGPEKEAVSQDPRSNEALLSRRAQLERAQAETWNRYQALGGAIQVIDELLRPSATEEK